MRLIAGAILILAAAVLFTAYWLSQTIHHPTLAGTPECGFVLVATVVVAGFGLSVSAIGLFADQELRD